jgi:hypothetical protein
MQKLAPQIHDFLSSHIRGVDERCAPSLHILQQHRDDTARLQLALDNGFTIIEHPDVPKWALGVSVIDRSLEPVEVLTLARLYGMQWDEFLTECAAQARKYDLLKWLLKCGCPWDLVTVLEQQCNVIEDLDHMKQVQAITGPWPADEYSVMMWCSGQQDDAVEAVKWCHEQGAPWPQSFFDLRNSPNGECWAVENVQWALANGSTWFEWQCQDLALQNYSCQSINGEHSDDTCDPSLCFKTQARRLFAWAHENGCPGYYLATVNVNTTIVCIDTASHYCSVHTSTTACYKQCMQSRAPNQRKEFTAMKHNALSLMLLHYVFHRVMLWLLLLLHYKYKGSHSHVPI